jgi:hypothetical protein
MRTASAVVAAAILLAGCVSSGVPFEDEPAVEVIGEVENDRQPHGVPICPPGYVNPNPTVSCVTPRPSPGS